MGCAITLPFLLLGAWPVLGFMGLDVLIVALAFRANFRAAGAVEDIRVTHVELHIARVSAQGVRREWRFTPSWVRIEREDHGDYGTLRLAVAARQRRVEVAACLGPAERAAFADRLVRALVLARRGPRFS